MAEGEKKKPGILIFVIVILSLVILVGSTAMVLMVNGVEISDVKERFTKHEEYVLDLDSFVVNLSTGGSGSYLKTQVSLMYTNKDKSGLFDSKKSLIRDTIIRVLMEYKPQDLLGAGGLDRMKEKLKGSLNTALGEEVIMEIYVIDFLVQ